MSSTLPDLYESIFKPSFVYNTASGFKVRLDTSLNGNVDIGDSSTSYNLTVNGVAYGGSGAPISASNWFLYPALQTIRTISAGNITLCAATIKVLGNLSSSGSITSLSGITGAGNSVFTNLSATGNFQTLGNAQINGNLSVSGTITGTLGSSNNVFSSRVNGLSNIFSLTAQDVNGSNNFGTNFTSFTQSNAYGFLQINGSSDMSGLTAYSYPLLSICHGSTNIGQTTNIFGAVAIRDITNRNVGLFFNTNSTTSEIKWSMSGASNSNFNYRLYESNDGTLYLSGDKSDNVFTNIASFRSPFAAGSSGYLSISGAGYTTKFLNRSEFSRDFIAAYSNFGVTATGDLDLPYTSVHMRTSSSNKYAMVALPSKKFTFGYYPTNSTSVFGSSNDGGAGTEQQIYDVDPVANTFTLKSKLVMSNNIDMQGNIISNATIVGSAIVTDSIINYNSTLPAPNSLFKFPTSPGVYQVITYSTDANNLVISAKFTVANNGTTYKLLFEPSLSTFTEVYPYIYNNNFYAIKNMKTFAFFGIKTSYSKLA